MDFWVMMSSVIHQPLSILQATIDLCLNSGKSILSLTRSQVPWRVRPVRKGPSTSGLPLLQLEYWTYVPSYHFIWLPRAEGNYSQHWLYIPGIGWIRWAGYDQTTSTVDSYYANIISVNILKMITKLKPTWNNIIKNEQPFQVLRLLRGLKVRLHIPRHSRCVSIQL